MKPRHVALVVALVLALIGFCYYLYTHSAQFVVLNPAGPIASGELSVIGWTLLLCALVVVPVFVMLFSFAWLYRADHPRARHHYFPDWDHHTRAAEIVWWLVPSIIIVALSILAWKSSYELDPYRPIPGSEPLTIQVVALQWKWLFIYPEQGIAAVNLLELPVGRPVRFELTADAPMNSFWIPQLGGQIMVMPGMSTRLHLMADRAGAYDGFSANISGAGFSRMTFVANAVSQEDFDGWVVEVQALRHPLTASAYRLLAAPSEGAVELFFPVQESLYSDIIMHSMGQSTMSADTMGPPEPASSTPMLQ